MSVHLARAGILAKQAVSGGGGTPTFDPATTSPIVWAKPESLASVGSGNGISSWADSSGNANHPAQATGGSQPTARASSLDGFYAAEFDGTDDFLATPNISIDAVAVNRKVTFLVVVRLDAAGNFPMVMTWQDARGELRYSGSSQQPSMAHTGAAATSGTPQTLGTWAILQGWLESQGAVGLRVNGGAAITSSDADDLTQTSPITIGQRTSGGLFLTARIAELFMWDRFLTLTEVNHIGADYLALKFPTLSWTTAT